MFIDFCPQQIFGAPAERNVLLDEQASLRWSEEHYGPDSSINIPSLRD